jgi:hypothetical protein
VGGGTVTLAGLLMAAVAGGALGWVAGVRYAVARRGWKDHRYHVRQVPETWRQFIAQGWRFVKWTALLVGLLAVVVAGIRA